MSTRVMENVMHSKLRTALEVLQQAASNGIKPLAGAADSSSIISGACNTIWQAAVLGRDIDRKPSADTAADLQQLVFLIEEEQLLLHLLTSAKHAVIDVGKQIRAAAAARPAGHAASDPYLTVTKALVLPAVQLLTTFAVVARAWRKCKTKQGSNDPLSSFADGMFLLISAERAGLLPILIAATPELVSALKQQQQQHHHHREQTAVNDESAVCIRTFASAVIQCLRYCFLADRPAQIFWDKNLGPAVLPAVKLAAALLLLYRSPLAGPTAPAAVDRDISACDTSTSTAASPLTAAAAAPGGGGAAAFDAWMQQWQADTPVGLETMAIADMMSISILQGYRYKPDSWTEEPPLMQLLAARELHDLLMLHMAAAAHRRYTVKAKLSSNAGTNSSSSSGQTEQAEQTEKQQQQQQQQQPASAPWHQQLYVACGLPASSDLTGMFELWEYDDPPMTSTQVLMLIQQQSSWNFWGQRLNTTSTEQGLMATRHEVQQLLQQQQQLSQATTAAWPHDPDFVVQPEKRLAVSLVMMEDVILAPHVKRAVINLKALSQLVVKGFCYGPYSKTAASAAGTTNNGVFSQEQREPLHAGGALDVSFPTVELLGPVLLCLWPVCQKILESFNPEAPESQDVHPEDLTALSECYASVVAVSLTAGKLSGRDDLLPLISRQPEIVLRSLEAAVRASCGAAPGQLQCLELKQLAMVIDLVLITPYACTFPGDPPGQRRLIPLTEQHGGSLEFFGMLLSSLKLSDIVSSRDPRQWQPPADLLEFILIPTSVQGLAGGISVLRLVHSSPSTRGGGVLLRWLWLVARSLLSFAETVEGLSAFGSLIRGGATHSPSETLGLILADLADASDWLGRCLEDLPLQSLALSSQQLEPVLNRQRHLALQLQAQQQQVLGVWPVGGASLTSTQLIHKIREVFPGALCNRIKSQAQDICALLPVPYCCNNPKCSSSTSPTEASSVKAGRCSGCKVARYCGASCQQQHWPLHKAVCKKIKQGPPEVAAAYMEAA